MGAEHCSPAWGEDPSLALPCRLCLLLPGAGTSAPKGARDGCWRGGHREGRGVRERTRRAGSLLWQGQLFRKFTFSYCSDRLPKPS